MDKKLPVYRITVTDKEDEDKIMIALVQNPAMESNFVAFNKHETETMMKFQVDSDRRIITGAVLIPNFKIYRNDETRGEHEVYLTEDDVELFWKKWARGGRHNEVNLMHNPENKPNGVYLLESILSDKERGIVAPQKLQGQFPNKTWFQSYLVEDDQVWGDVKSGKFKGFSMEMMANYMFSKQDKPTDDFSELIAILNNF